VDDLFNEMKNLVIAGNGAELIKRVSNAREKGIAAKDILFKGLIAGMDIVGQRMKSGEMFIPEVLLSARTMQAVIDAMGPYLTEKDLSAGGIIVIGTVEGDLHDIGKNLVALMLKGAGFKVIDLGVDVKPNVFVEAVKTHKAQIIGMSALLTTTIVKMKETIMALETAGLRHKVKVMAGGAPVTQNLADDFGADAYGNSAPMAVEIAKRFIATD